MADKEQDLILNILPFTHPQKTKTFGFYKEKREQMAPLQTKEFPDNYRDSNTDAKASPLYSNFENGDDAPLQLELNLTQAPEFAANYYNKRIFSYFKDIADVRKHDFIYRNELWFRDKTADNTKRRAYKRFTVCASVGRYTDAPELRVIFKGHTFLLPQAVIDYNHTTDLNWIVSKGLCFRYDTIPENVHIDFNEAYPVINRLIRQRKGMDFQSRFISNKVKRYYNQIEWFRQKYLDCNDFKAIIPLKDGHWLQPEANKINRTPDEANKLLFGGNGTDIVPHYGLKKFGPYKPPEEKRVSIFFIVHEDDTKTVANTLTKYLRDGLKSFPGLRRYANLPMQFKDEHIVFTDADNPLPEVKKKLQHNHFEKSMQHLAIYLSPISKDDPDEAKRRVYYSIKEELLKYKVSSQVIDCESIADKHFNYYLPNIAVAILAKLGGAPWQLLAPPEKELIVGVGAFRPSDFNNQYIGSAFCFSNRGHFEGFQCFAKKETDMLAGSIRKAVRKYISEHDKPERLVIHYYKKMSHRERQPIMHMLHHLGLKDIDVIVVTINKTESRDVILFDKKSSAKMPLSGTYVQLHDGKLLLCNNTRYHSQGKPPRNYPFPVKLQIGTGNDDPFSNEINIRKIVEQVYQFSRIYWKSITQQNLPVTIKYPELVAQMFPYFESRVMPKFGRENLWFL
jgi:hypothetical protein